MNTPTLCKLALTMYIEGKGKAKRYIATTLAVFDNKGRPMDESKYETDAAYTIRAVNGYKQSQNALKSALADSARLTLEVKRLRDTHEELLATVKHELNWCSKGNPRHNRLSAVIARAERK